MDFNKTEGDAFSPWRKVEDGVPRKPAVMVVGGGYNYCVLSQK